MYLHVYQTSQYHRHRWTVAFETPKFSELKSIQNWCVETYGTDQARWFDHIRWGEVYFRDEADVTLFVMKWE